MSYTPESFQQEYQALQQHARRVTEDLTSAQFNWRPQTGKWSVGECFGHLNVIGERYLAQIETELDQQGTGRPGTFQPSLFARFSARMMEPPYRMKMKTVADMSPTVSDVEKAATVERFCALHGGFADRLENVTAGDLAKVQMRSPYVSAMRMNLGGWLGFLAAHARRHLWQAEQVREHPQFPQVAAERAQRLATQPR